MATNREMLKEAIADAKAVKETAIANAKAALEEAFTPQLKEMLSLKLQEMEDEDLEDATKRAEKGDSTDLALHMAGIKEEDDMTNEIDLEELLAELNEEEDMDEAINEAEEEEEEESEESEEGEEEGEPIELEDMTDEDLKSMIEDVIKDMIEAGELEAGHEGEEGEEGAEGEEEIGIEDEEEIDLAELLREIEEIDEIEESEAIDEAKMKKEKEDKKEDEDKKKLKKELDEAYSAIETLKDELNEINLLNAKLLYTNKIFKAKNLNESQKVKVLSSFDKAKNVGEVKMVFETLNEGIKVSKNTIKEHLGSASKGTITPGVKKPIVESNEAFTRMQKLAGII
jgi:hypothetical protein